MHTVHQIHISNSWSSTSPCQNLEPSRRDEDDEEGGNAHDPAARVNLRTVCQTAAIGGGHFHPVTWGELSLKRMGRRNIPPTVISIGLWEQRKKKHENNSWHLLHLQKHQLDKIQHPSECIIIYIYIKRYQSARMDVDATDIVVS